MEKEHHDRTIHALPFRNEEKPARSGKKAWRAAVLVAVLVVLLVGGWVLIHFLSTSAPVQETPAPPALSPNIQDKEPETSAATHRGEQASHTTSPELKAERDGADAKQDGADGNGKEQDTRQAVLRHLALAREHEREGRDALAFGAYQEALRLDPGSEEARSAADRVKRNIAEDQFRRHMSDGFTAFHQGDYALAKAEFQKAGTLRPGAPEAGEALALADGAVKLKKLEELKAKAAAEEKAEAWEKALDLYLAALKIDGALQFALEGKERAMERMTLKKRLSFYLEKPDVLESDDYLQKAVQLLDQARSVEPGGPRHREEVQRLQRLIQDAQTRIPVTLMSDNLTEVSVFKVGKLGIFNEHELFLRPGKYTIIGSRNGYQDVREEILVKARDTNHRVTVICREKI